MLQPPFRTPEFLSLRPQSPASCAGHRYPPSPQCCRAREPRGLSWLDLAKGRLRLDRLCRNGCGSTFFPWASPIPRETRKSHRRHPPLRFGPKTGASSIAFGLQIAIEAAMVAGSNTKEK
jgi:hypothetical protein